MAAAAPSREHPPAPSRQGEKAIKIQPESQSVTLESARGRRESGAARLRPQPCADVCADERKRRASSAA